jgi:hypothetical protein
LNFFLRKIFVFLGRKDTLVKRTREMLLTSRYWKYEKRDERAEILEIQMSKPESGKPILKLNLG